MLKGLFLIVVSITQFMGCSSLTKQGQAHLEAGAYEEAEAAFKHALEKDPSDTQAAIGLKEARDGYVDKNLIQARMARIAGNQHNSAELLKTVILKEKAWHHSPSSQQAFTQLEELEYSRKFIEDRVTSFLSEKRPLKAESYFLGFKEIFEDQSVITKHALISKNIHQVGRQSCMNFQTRLSAKYPYFSEFVNRYCSHFGSVCKSCGKFSQAMAKDLISTLEVEGQVQGLPSTVAAQSNSKMKEAFQKSPWHDRNGKNKLVVQLNGKYDYSHEKTYKEFSHQYEVNEPYQTTEMVAVPKQVPRTNYVSQYDPVSRTYISVPVKETHTEYTYVSQIVTKYQLVTRTFPYYGTEHKQKMNLSLLAETKLGADTLTIALNEAKDHVTEEHQINKADIGLKPKIPKLIQPESWLEAQLNTFSHDFFVKSKDHWNAYFCRQDSFSTADESLGNLVQQCLRGEPKAVPQFVETWYQNTLGLDMQKAEEVLAK